MYNFKYIFSLIWEGLRAKRSYFFSIVIGVLLLKLAYSAIVLKFGAAIDDLSQGNKIYKNIFEIGFLATVILIFQPLVSKRQSLFVQTIVFNKTMEWYNCLFQKELNFFTENNAARVSSIISRSVVAHEKILIQFIDIIFPVLVEWMIALFFLLNLSGVSALIFLVISITLQILVTLKIINYRRPLISNINDIEDLSAEESNELLQKGILFQINNTIHLALARLQVSFEKYLNGSVNLSVSASALNMVPFNFNIIAQLFGLMTAAYYIPKGLMTIGEGVAFITLVARFSLSTGEAINALRFLDQFKIDITQLKKMLQQPSFFKPGAQIDNIDEFRIDGIAFKSDNFQINIPDSMTFKKGDRVAIVGPSGHGKTTFLSCISGMVPAFRSNINLNGMSLNQVSSDSHLDLIKVCPQDSMIFPGTVKENIFLQEDATGGFAHHALFKNLGLDNLLTRLECKINAKQISGGEARRLSLTRVFLKPAEIVLFDEPTTGLNDFLREKVWNFIRNFSTNKIVFVVTHDEDSIKYFNKKIVVENGIARLMSL